MKKNDGKPKKVRPSRTRSPRKENTIIEQWTAPDKLTLISCWARDNYTDKEIAEKMGISLPTLRSYCLKRPELDAAVRNSKEIVDYRVETALLTAALGSQTTKVKIIAVYKNNTVVSTIKEKTIEQQPPNVLACQTWLFNRQRDKWKRNRDNEVAVEDDKSISITIKRAKTRTTDGNLPGGGRRLFADSIEVEDV